VAVNADLQGATCAMHLLQQALAVLEDPAMQQPLAQHLRQLQQLSAARDAAGSGQSDGTPLLTFHQLRYALHCGTYTAAALMEVRLCEGAQLTGRPPPQPQTGAASQVVASSMASLVSLEPHSVKSLMLEATGAPASQETSACLRCFHEAQRQGCDCTAARAAIFAVTYAANCSTPVSPNTLLAALAALQHAEPALRRCKRLLPQPWLAELEISLPFVQATCRRLTATAVIRLQQQLLHPLGQQAAVEAVARHRQETYALGVQAQSASQCSGCGRHAVGLRRCAACQQAQYCRWVGGGGQLAVGI